MSQYIPRRHLFLVNRLRKDCASLFNKGARHGSLVHQVTFKFVTLLNESLRQLKRRGAFFVFGIYAIFASRERQAVKDVR